MPLPSLRHPCSDGVADIDSVFVRTHIFGGASGGGGAAAAPAPDGPENSSVRSTPTGGVRTAGHGASVSLRRGQTRPSVGDAHRLRASPRRQPETLCILDSCCCGGSLLILWMNSEFGGVSSSEASPYHKKQSAAYLDRTGSISTCSVDDQLTGYGSCAGGPGGPGVPEPTSPEPPSDERLGRIQFSLSYDFRLMTLNLKVICAVDLAAKDISGTSDPYVKILLLPDKKHKLTTNIKRKNLNPKWNEVFAFEGFPFSKLMSRILYLQVLDYDRFSRDDPIGEVCVPLQEVDLLKGETLWKTLQPCKGQAGRLGEILFSLCYQPAAESLSVNIVEARGLKSKDINGLSDPYVKIWVLRDGKKAEKRKTAIIERTLNPVFNELFLFRFPYEHIRQTTLVISVMDHDRMGRNELIGQVVLGSKSGPTEVKHWKEMFARSRQSVAHWHVLRNCR